MSDRIYEPNGIRFRDSRVGEMLLVQQPGHGFDGWLCYRHPDGQWVTLRKATQQDLDCVAEFANGMTGLDVDEVLRARFCFWLGRPPCPKCGQDHGDKNCSVERDAELRLDHATNSLVAWALTCRMQNSGEWMAGLADRVNHFLDQVGDNDRYHFDGDGFSKGKGKGCQR